MAVNDALGDRVTQAEPGTATAPQTRRTCRRWSPRRIWALQRSTKASAANLA